MVKKPKQAPMIFGRAWRRLAPLLQLDLFEDRDALARIALADLQALEKRLKKDQETRSA
jgi:hypothetical protein